VGGVESAGQVFVSRCGAGPCVERGASEVVRGVICNNKVKIKRCENHQADLFLVCWLLQP